MKLINDRIIAIFIVSLLTIISFSLFLSNMDKEKLQSLFFNSEQEVIDDVVIGKEDALTRRVIVFDNMTLSELSEKLNRSMKDTLSGKGELLASYCLEKGVDPYIALSIILLESG